jgi:hypothetical protein
MPQPEAPPTAAREKMFQYDETLPRLPVPELHATFAGLRDSVRAVIESEDELREYDRLVEMAIPQLQAAQDVLRKRAEELPNYIGPWWTEFAYLRSRYPNVLNTNVFCVRDSDFDALGAPHPLTVDPVVRAAMVARESLAFRRMILREELPVEKMAGKQPMCMKQYRSYWTTRIPGIEMDTLHVPDPATCKRIAIMHRGAFFFVSAVLNDETEDDLNLAELTEVMRLGFSKLRPPHPDECIGTLTAAERPKWATARQELESRSANNRRVLRELLQVVTIICVDDEPVNSLKEGINRASHEHPHNRWYDRSSLRIVSSNGICMEHGDHTAMDAIVMASTPVDLMSKFSRDFVQQGGLKTTVVRANFEPLKYLEMVHWDLHPSVKTLIREAAETHEANCRGIEIDCFSYLGFGREALRNAKINADAFVQQALQLAVWRDRGHVLPVYETASTRLYREGRTDTIRSLTLEQKLFVTTFDDHTVSAIEKKKRFGAALSKHAAITTRSSMGKGYDRHLLALRIAQQHVLNKTLPKVFDNPAVVRSSTYQLLTSQMIGRYFVGGFAHVLDDGYGCCYYLRRNAICIVVSGCNRAGLTNLDRFQRNLTKAFHDLAMLVMSPSENIDEPIAKTPTQKPEKQQAKETEKSKL